MSVFMNNVDTISSFVQFLLTLTILQLSLCRPVLPKKIIFGSTILYSEKWGFLLNVELRWQILYPMVVEEIHKI